MKITELNVFPIKSARSQSLKEMKITHEGPEGDRQWMLVDENGKFISQRTVPRLASVEVFQDDTALTVGLGKMFFKISKKNSFSRKVKVSVWNDTFEAALEPDLYSQGIAQYLGVHCRLVRYAPFSQRRVLSLNKEWKPEVRFSDGRPLQLLNLKSLEDLNSKLPSPIGTDRFRANIVFNGSQAFEEDKWKKIRIGDVVFSQPKKCARCTIITIDQQTGASMGPEPLKTLATYRREDKGVFFGTLWIPENEGTIKLTDSVEVLE
ncbi:MOSC domain-containing protein [Bdellovibrio reynosensis]|uniref:MOSC domain-containing protein n=1 Tax=Bdellovibrio reynosensis TaxID=2835041 RepID=A0ABY4CA48_9BACT|nr:MOSC domain-containing protein [Bdellovibrio reynosensis]